MHACMHATPHPCTHHEPPPCPSHTPQEALPGSDAGSPWASVSLCHKLLTQIPPELLGCQALIGNLIDTQQESEDMAVK